MNKLMLKETDQVAKETEDILQNAYKRFNLPIVEDISDEPSAMNVKGSSTEKVAEETKETSEEKTKDLDSSTLEEEVHEEVDTSLPDPAADSRIEGEQRKEERNGQEEAVKGGEEYQTKKITWDSSEVVEGKKTLSLARDTAEAVKDFLTKEMMELDEPELLQAPINFDSLSPVQTMKVTSFAQAKAKYKLMKSHMEDCELIEIASGALEKIMPSF